MNDEEQKKVFSKNLMKQIMLNQKQQIDVAKDLDIKPTTFNMWCTGKSLPSVGKIQKLADYFKIGKTDLTDEKNEKDLDAEFSEIIMKIGLTDARFKEIIIKYSKLPVDKKDLLCEFFEKFVF